MNAKQTHAKHNRTAFGTGFAKKQIPRQTLPISAMNAKQTHAKHNRTAFVTGFAKRQIPRQTLPISAMNAKSNRKHKFELAYN